MKLTMETGGMDRIDLELEIEVPLEIGGTESQGVFERRSVRTAHSRLLGHVTRNVTDNGLYEAHALHHGQALGFGKHQSIESAVEAIVRFHLTRGL